jgi:hypothetical protein
MVELSSIIVLPLERPTEMLGSDNGNVLKRPSGQYTSNRPYAAMPTLLLCASHTLILTGCAALAKGFLADVYPTQMKNQPDCAIVKMIEREKG